MAADTPTEEAARYLSDDRARRAAPATTGRIFVAVIASVNPLLRPEPMARNYMRAGGASLNDSGSRYSCGSNGRSRRLTIGQAINMPPSNGTAAMPSWDGKRDAGQLLELVDQAVLE